jgi:hypothetical protein
MSEAADGTGAGLLDFLEWAGSRGEIAQATAKAMAVAVRKVLAIEGNPDAVDVRALHVADIFGRFETLNRTGYSTDSLATYRSRFSTAVAMYLAWLDKLPGWKTAGRADRRAPGSAVAVAGGQGNDKPAARRRPSRSRTGASAARQPSPDTEPVAEPSPASPMIPYDLPLRPGLRVRLVLPEVLTRADASRIAAFVSSLAFDQDDTQPEGG